MYYLEIWLRDFAKDYLREISEGDVENYHPHITLVRPFEILTNEEDIKNKIVNFCKDKKPINFSLDGAESFDHNIHYIPVTNESELLKFSDDLESLLKNDVKLVPKLGEKKTLHATVMTNREIEPVPKIEQQMLRLTAIRNKKIWFSYDFENQKVLDREESLETK